MHAFTKDNKVNMRPKRFNRFSASFYRFLLVLMVKLCEQETKLKFKRIVFNVICSKCYKFISSSVFLFRIFGRSDSKDVALLSSIVIVQQSSSFVKGCWLLL